MSNEKFEQQKGHAKGTDNNSSSLSNYAQDLMRAAVGGALGTLEVGKKVLPVVVPGAGILEGAATALIGGAALKAGIDASKVLPEVGIGMAGGLIGGVVGAEVAKRLARPTTTLVEQAAEQAVKGAVQGAVGAGAAEAARKALIGGAVGGGAVIAGEVAKENKDEIKAAGKVAVEVGKEIVSTPKDVIDHMKKRPVTAAIETIIFPPAVIIDAKLRKLFGGN